MMACAIIPTAAMTSQLDSRHLHIAHLARRLTDMGHARVVVDPVGYRLMARRIRQAMAGFGDASLFGTCGAGSQQVGELLEKRRFDELGVLREFRGSACRAQAAALFAALGVRRRPVEWLPAAGTAPIRSTRSPHCAAAVIDRADVRAPIAGRPVEGPARRGPGRGRTGSDLPCAVRLRRRKAAQTSSA